MKLLQGPKGTLVLFDYIVSLLAIVGNCLVLESVLKVHFDLTGYRRFLISLAISDLYICGVNLLSFIHATVTMYSNNSQMEKCGADFLRSLQFVGFFANLLNLCGMSVDHFIGIVYPLRYCDLMNKRVTQIAVVAIWVTSFVLGFADFPIATAVYLTNHYEPAPATTSDFSFPGATGGGGADFSSLGLGNFGFGLPDFSNGNSSALAPDEILKNPLLAKNLDAGAGYDDPSTESTANPFAFIENISGLSSEELFASLDQSGSVISDISNMIANGTQPGSGSGEENVEKTLYEEILKIVQHKKENVDWCTFYLSNKVWLEFSVMTLTLACFIFLIICYGRIFKEVFVNIDPSERNTRKLVVTTFLLLGAFTICWLPFMIFEFSMIIVLRADTDTNNTRTLAGSAIFLIVHNIFNSLLMCYPLLDPVIYAARMRIVRRYILTQYGRFCPCFRDYIQRVTTRRTSVFTYSLTSQQYVPASKTNSMSSAINGTANNTYNNARLTLLNSNDYSRQYSISESAFNSKRPSASVSNVSVNEAPEWQDEQPNYTMNLSLFKQQLTINNSASTNRSNNNLLSPVSNHHPSTPTSICPLPSNGSDSNRLKVVDPAEVEDSVSSSIRCPPLIYRRGNSFKRQVRQIFARSSHQNQQQEQPVATRIKVTTDLDQPLQENGLSICYETEPVRTSSASSNRPNGKTYFGGSKSDEDEDQGRGKWSNVAPFSRSKLKSRSSYQIPLSLEQDVTPSNSSASAGVSTTSSSAPSYGPDDSSTRLLPDHDPDSDIEDPPFATTGNQQLPGFSVLRRSRCPCSEFANSQAVVDKFRDNSLRLLGVGTLGPDHSSCTPTNHQCGIGGSSDSGHDTPLCETKPPVVRSFIGKSPTVGDFSSPSDDLRNHLSERH